MMSRPSRLHDSLHREHLEEVSFFYDQRGQWLEDPTLSLRDVADLEERLEAHLDALVVAGDDAAVRCTAAIDSGDRGELHAALRVACRRDRPEILAALAERSRVASGDDAIELALAATLALGFEVRADWAPALEPFVREPALVEILAGVATLSRIELGAALAQTRGVELRAECARLSALGELRHAAAGDQLCLAALDPSTHRAAAIALLKLGGHDLPRAVAHSADPVVRLWLDGDDERVWAACERSPDAAHVQALGLSGAPRSLGLLTELLAEPGVASEAAGGLAVATGAALLEACEEVVFPRVGDDDDDDDDGDAPANSRARMRLCRDGDAWRSWLREHAASPPRRRMGHVPSAHSTAWALTSVQIPMSLRELLCDELMVRWGIAAPVRPQMPARRQLDALARTVPGFGQEAST